MIRAGIGIMVALDLGLSVCCPRIAMSADSLGRWYVRYEL